MGRITLVEGDISEQDVDAIVNAANNELILGTGVAGAIRKRGGPTIQQECDAIGPIKLGDAAVTGAGDLPARHVLHAAAMAPGGVAEETHVRESLRAALLIAAENGFRTIAIPALGTGVGGFSLQRCAEVSLDCTSKQRLPSKRYASYCSVSPRSGCSKWSTTRLRSQPRWTAWPSCEIATEGFPSRLIQRSNPILNG